MKFKLSTLIGVFEKKIGVEEIFIELSEMDMISMLNLFERYNNKLFKKLKLNLIDEAIKEGYEMSFDSPKIKTKCPNCKEVIQI